ncbi:MAG: hypothetical protein RR646_07000 [Erysipelotrichaceae bacterium]
MTKMKYSFRIFNRLQRVLNNNEKRRNSISVVLFVMLSLLLAFNKLFNTFIDVLVIAYMAETIAHFSLVFNGPVDPAFEQIPLTSKEKFNILFISQNVNHLIVSILMGSVCILFLIFSDHVAIGIAIMYSIILVLVGIAINNVILLVSFIKDNARYMTKAILLVLFLVVSYIVMNYYQAYESSTNYGILMFLIIDLIWDPKLTILFVGLAAIVSVLIARTIGYKLYLKNYIY